MWRCYGTTSSSFCKRHCLYPVSPLFSPLPLPSATWSMAVTTLDCEHKDHSLGLWSCGPEDSVEQSCIADLDCLLPDKFAWEESHQLPCLHYCYFWVFCHLQLNLILTNAMRLKNQTDGLLMKSKWCTWIPLQPNWGPQRQTLLPLVKGYSLSPK